MVDTHNSQVNKDDSDILVDGDNNVTNIYKNQNNKTSLSHKVLKIGSISLGGLTLAGGGGGVGYLITEKANQKEGSKMKSIINDFTHIDSIIKDNTLNMSDKYNLITILVKKHRLSKEQALEGASKLVSSNKVHTSNDKVYTYNYSNSPRKKELEREKIKLERELKSLQSLVELIGTTKIIEKELTRLEDKIKALEKQIEELKQHTKESK